jgi:hypothetical protein
MVFVSKPRKSLKKRSNKKPKQTSLSRRLNALEKAVEVKIKRTRVTSLTDFAVAGHGLVTQYQIAAGSDDGERDGARITPKRLDMHLRVNNTSNSERMVRIVIVKYNAFRSSPSVSDFMVTTGGSGFYSWLPLSEPKWHLYKHSIVHDQVYDVNVPYGLAAGYTTINISKKLNGFQLYDGALSTDVTKDQYIVWMLPNASAVSSDFQFVYETAFHYTDA